MSLSVFITLVAFTGAAPDSNNHPTEGPASVDLNAWRNLPLNERVVAIAKHFLGKPYVLSALGEGEEGTRDTDPLIRFDAFDCVTYVEEVAALALSNGRESTLGVLSAIRYATEPPRWESRNHLTEAQWVPNNVRKGFFVDVTRHYAGPLAVSASKKLTSSSWQTPAGKSLELEESVRPLGDFALDIVPARDALRVLRKVPSGTVVVVVRADSPNRITRVSHVGFLVNTKSGLTLRHASKSFHKTVDEPLEQYLRRNLDYAPWTIAGFALFEIRNPP